MTSKPLTIITGASGAMGSAAVESLAREGRSIVMACRSREKGEAVRESILGRIPDADLQVSSLDLSSLDSVRDFTASLRGCSIEALFNNAGIINRSYRLTPDGLENTIATNYVGPYLLTRMLLPLIPDGGHIVNMVSLTCSLSEISEDILHEPEEKFSQLGTYARSKLALMLFSIALARKCPRLRVNMADPGVVDSNMISMHRWFDPLADIFFRPFIKSPRKGVQPALSAIHSNLSGYIFKGHKHSLPEENLLKGPLADRLWDLTEAITGADKVSQGKIL